MSNSFISVAIAHDYTCPKGEEWLFHGVPKLDIGVGDTKAKKLSEDEVIEQMIDMDKEDDENDTFWSWVIATIISLLIGAGVVVFIICKG